MKFHPGELSAQLKAGTRGVAAELAVHQRRKLNFTANHDAFLAAQSFAVVTSISNNHVWVTPLFGKAGDLNPVSESEIIIHPRCIPKSDVLHDAIHGTPLSLLAIDLDKRIRHRINGVFSEKKRLQVREYSPNCPKYINRRELLASDTPLNQNAVRHEYKELSKADRRLIGTSDTLWIGTHHDANADTNHRGGQPGFIRVTSPSSMEWGEYRGNGMFYTSGNLESNDRAGVTILDFETGDLLQMTGTAIVDWQHDGTYEGATRKMMFQIERIVRTNQVTNHRWKFLDYSPYNPAVGNNNIDHPSEYPVTVTLAKIVPESPNVKTFRWIAPRQIAFLPGQYATFELNVPGAEASAIRTWTLSETPNSMNGDNTLDITVKRNGVITNWLHDHAQVGLQVQLHGVQGEMTAIRFRQDDQRRRPVVPKNLLLVSAGIGITPNVAIVRGIGAFELSDATNITMIHVERHIEDLIFQSELQRRTRAYKHFSLLNLITSKTGRPTSLREYVPEPAKQTVYLCGPQAFMDAMTADLVETVGVPASQIHTESFAF